MAVTDTTEWSVISGSAGKSATRGRAMLPDPQLNRAAVFTGEPVASTGAASCLKSDSTV